MLRRWQVWLLLLLLPALGFVWKAFDGRGAGPPTLRLETGIFERAIYAEGVLRPAVATPILSPADIQESMRIAWMAPEGERVEAGQVVVRFDPTDLERAVENAQADLDKLGWRREGDLARSDAAIENLGRDAQAATLEEENATRFLRRDDVIFSRKEILESEIDSELAAERRDHALDARQRRERQAAADTGQLAIERRKANLDLSQAASGMANLEVLAPHSGVLVYQRNFMGQLPSVGQSIWPGQKLAELPKLEEVEAELFVLEADAGGLEAGLEIGLVVDAHPLLSFKGKVTRVEKLSRPRVRGSPVQYFTVIAKLDEVDPAHMKPGQRVQARILCERLEDVIVVPRTAVFDQEGQSVVFRRNGRDFEVVAVEAGAGTGRVVIQAVGAIGAAGAAGEAGASEEGQDVDGKTVAVRPLRAGDELALEDPRTLGDGDQGPSSAGQTARPASGGFGR